MDVTDFLHGFRRLETNNSRQEALDRLLDEITPYEWRALHAHTSSRSFQFDIVGKAPLELVAHVFRYLDTTAPYRYQIVSRRWNHNLRSLHVLKASLGPWYEGTVDLHTFDYALCLQKARNIHSFRTGKPSSIYKITPSETASRLSLVGNYLIWDQYHYTDDPQRGSRQVCILHLETWRLRTVCGEAREQLFEFHASDEIVVLTTFANIAYVYELEGPRFKKFRVPSGDYFKTVACRALTVACVASFAEHTSVYIWQYDTGRGRTFKIDHDPGTLFSIFDPYVIHAISPLIQPETETIILFVDAQRSEKLPYDQRKIAYSRYTYSGECIGDFQPSLPGIGSIESMGSWERFVPVNFQANQFAIPMRSALGEGQDRIHTFFLLHFDEGLNSLRVWEDSQLPGPIRCSGGAMAWWKDTCYGFFYHEGERRDMIAHMGTSDKKTYTPIVSEPRHDTPWAYHRSRVNALVVLNDKYVIRSTASIFYVLCFDGEDNGNRPKENGPFFDLGTLEVLGK
ncbi:hypothetical protein BDW02DRAFT_572103 [Decorospora gaudefroyi]|uniref:F-box domain-containing protein n=1 Tax=Decorospora gaudefroyi TaxID=184978 RepID=A0A6A5K5I6_9PLEO|nr:hypothetical protein BDW02DRAFT_572103 [Decorospora gaudefroyi]